MRKWFILGVVLVLVVVSFCFDSLIVEKVSLLRSGLLDDFFLGITFVSSELIVFFFLTSLFLWSQRKRKWILPLWITLGLSVVVSFIGKYFVGRQRPYQAGVVAVLPVLEKASHLTWNFSFPSFQSMLVFCAVPILSINQERTPFAWSMICAPGRQRV